MKTLDLSQINILAPYPVWYEEGEIMFKTDYNILYSIAFELDDMLNLKAYWFRITNRSRKKSPNDKKIQQTVILVIEEFFNENYAKISRIAKNELFMSFSPQQR